MKVIHIPNIESVWSTIRSLPVGVTTITTPNQVASLIQKCVQDYTRHHFAVTGENKKPIILTSVGMSMTQVSNRTMTVKVMEWHRWLDFEPKWPIKTMVSIALQRLADSSENSVLLECGHEKLAQVRNMVAGRTPTISVKSHPSGCVLSFKYDNNSALASLVQDSLIALSDESSEVIFIPVDPSEQIRGKRIVMRTAAKKGVRVKVYSVASGLRVQPLGDKLTEECDKIVEVLASKGYHHAQIKYELVSAVERYRIKALGLEDIEAPHQEEVEERGPELINEEIL